jgi:Arc/MetJ-type ribon-helix-helix transcriptional regulator
MNTEKVSVNVNVVDLGKMELLIEKGIYTNKTDFMVKAITNELNKNEAIFDKTIKELDTDVHIQIGKVSYDKEKLEKMKAANVGVKLYVIGRLTIAEDVSQQLAVETLLSIRVFGPSKMSDQLKEYYKLK